jgi:hypothetical protein
MMDWKKIFVDYWSQVTIILLAFGYFIKRAFDLKSKKIEVNHSLFQQNRIQAVNSFVKNFATVEQMWRHFEIHKILSNQLSAKEIDDIIWPSMNSLRASVLELMIYFDDDATSVFKKIMNNFIDINGHLFDKYFFSGNIKKMPQMVDAFADERDKILDENKELYKRVAGLVRRSYS